jgi:excinuclease ABC subunit A
MSAKAIRIRGARTHNLDDVDLDLPREAWTVVCGRSGSGKSSLVLDTLGAESQRRFLGTVRGARGSELLDPARRPDVDRIDGLPPAVTAGFTARDPGPRQTLGTLSEITHALRVLFARVGQPRCPTCADVVQARTRNEITAALLDLPEATRVVLLAPRGRGPGALGDAGRDGFVRVRIGNGPIQRLEEVDAAAVDADARVEVVVDRLVVKGGAAERFAASVDQGLDLGGGVLRAVVDGSEVSPDDRTFADRPYCGRCDVAWPRLSPATFSFNSPAGACPTCEGRGTVPVLDPERVLPRRMRLRRVALHLGRHVGNAAREALERRLARAWKQAGLQPGDRVADLPEAVRTRLLAGTSRTRGLLDLLGTAEAPPVLTTPRACDACDGRRVGPFARAVILDPDRPSETTLPALEALGLDALDALLASLPLPGAAGALAAPARDDARARIAFLRDVGLAYLSLDRAGATLSGGELRRTRLAAACAARMSGLLFLLDEPTAGLHPADRGPLRTRLRELVDEGNTVVCVEHDVEMLLEADHVVELGPGAGAAGGRVIAAGDVRTFLASPDAATAAAIRAVPPPPRARPRHQAGRIEIEGARRHNLRGVDASFPLHGLTCVTGVSGAGKSTLLLEVLAPAVRSILDRAPFPTDRVDACRGVDGLDRLSVARGAPSRHPRATPGSVLAVLPPLRRLFAATLEARTRGWAPARFSRHVAGGRCEACHGAGERRVALRDLAPVEVVCDACEGTGFHRDTLKVRVKGLSIADVLALPLEGAGTLFRDIPTVARPLAAATDVGLGYVPLGEPTSRLSGGEALRLRLAAALGRGGHTPTLYLLDEPSAGLHPADVDHLAQVLLGLAGSGHTVVCVEHDASLVRVADHVVELGPGPGDAGGRLVYEGPPAGLLACDASPTGAALDAADRRHR